MKIFGALVILTLFAGEAHAQPRAEARARGMGLAVPAESLSPWSVMSRYSVTSDFADNRSPRGYTHALLGTLGYTFTRQISLEMTAGGRAETIGGQIQKGSEETYNEKFSPSTAFALSYEGRFAGDQRASLYLEGEPLWTKLRASRATKESRGGRQCYFALAQSTLDFVK